MIPPEPNNKASAPLCLYKWYTRRADNKAVLATCTEPKGHDQGLYPTKHQTYEGLVLEKYVPHR